MSRSRFRMGSLGVALLALLLCQCASRPATVEPTYKGLTLEQWSEFPWKGQASLHEGSGRFEFERDWLGALAAMGAFAGESDVALARLQALVADLHEDVREEAAAELTRVALSSEPNQPEAMQALLACVRSDDPRPSSAALGQLLAELEDRDDWSCLGVGGEEVLVASAAALLYEDDEYAIGIATEALLPLARRSTAHESRFLAALSAPAPRFRSEEAAGALSDLALDFAGGEEPALAPALFLRAAELAVELEPEEPEYLDTLARVHERLGDRARALEAARRALEATQRVEVGKGMRQRIQENFERLSGAEGGD